MPRFRNSTNTNFWYFRCKTHYSRIDNSSIYVNIKIYLTILTSLIFLDICIPVPVSLIFETSLAFMCYVEPSFSPSYSCFCTFCPLDGSNHIFVSDSRRPLTISFFLESLAKFFRSGAELIYSILLDVFSCMDYSSLYFLKSVFTFTTIHINCKPGFSF